jgi:hypothetical protein
LMLTRSATLSRATPCSSCRPESSEHVVTNME